MIWFVKIFAGLVAALQARRRLAEIGDRRSRQVLIPRSLVASANHWVKLFPAAFCPTIVFDIGANRGTISRELNQLYRLQFAALVEPIPQLAARLQTESFAARQMVFTCALGQKAGCAHLNLYANDASSSLLEVTDAARTCFHLPFTKREELSVPLRTLDSIFDESGVTQVDLLKIDVQGLEMEVLKGGLKCLAATNFVLLEVSFYPHYHTQPLFHEVYAYLLEQGFSLRRLLDYVDKDGGAAFQCDALFVKTTK